MKKVVFSSLQNFTQLLLQYPALLGIAAFSPLSSLIEHLKADAGGCACNKNDIFLRYKGSFESAITSLQQADKDRIKSILNADQVCYYVRNDRGGLELVCF